MVLKIKYSLTEIHYASVLLVKIYGSNASEHKRIKLGISVSLKEDNRLVKLQSMPADITKYNAVVETIANNECRGKQLEGKITNIPTLEETDIILHYIYTFCKDQFVLDFINGSI